MVGTRGSSRSQVAEGPGEGRDSNVVPFAWVAYNEGKARGLWKVWKARSEPGNADTAQVWEGQNSGEEKYAVTEESG